MQLQTVVTLALAALAAQVGAVQRRMRSETSVLDSADATMRQTTDVKVGMITWNVGELLKNDDEALVAALVQALSGGPDIFAFGYQENILDKKQTVTVLRQAANGALKTYAVDEDAHAHRSNTLAFKSGHGYSGIVVFRKEASAANGACATGVNSGYRSGVQSNEKGLSSVTCPVNNQPVCFGSTHSDPDKYWKGKGETKTRDDGRVQHFKKYSEYLANGGCVFVFYGGDFNWRNANWNQFKSTSFYGADSTDFHEHFRDKGVHKWIKSLQVDGFVQSLTDTSEVPAILLGNEGTPNGALGALTDERTTRPEHWLEGPTTKSTQQLAQPPTFQPAKCPSTLGTGTDSDPLKKPPAAQKSKSPLCIKVAAGGNCKNDQDDGFMCFSAQRPICWTDAIYHRVVKPGEGGTNEIKSTSYGPVIKPTNSDHYPVVGTYTVTVSFPSLLKRSKKKQ